MLHSTETQELARLVTARNRPKNPIRIDELVGTRLTLYRRLGLVRVPPGLRIPLAPGLVSPCFLPPQHRPFSLPAARALCPLPPGLVLDVQKEASGRRRSPSAGPIKCVQGLLAGGGRAGPILCQTPAQSALFPCACVCARASALSRLCVGLYLDLPWRSCVFAPEGRRACGGMPAAGKASQEISQRHVPVPARGRPARRSDLQLLRCACFEEEEGERACRHAGAEQVGGTGWEETGGHIRLCARWLASLYSRSATSDRARGAHAGADMCRGRRSSAT